MDWYLFVVLICISLTANMQPSHPCSLPSSSTSVFPSISQFPTFPSLFPVSRLFASRGQSFGASAWVLPMNSQGWFPSGLAALLLAVQATPKNLLQRQVVLLVLHLNGSSYNLDTSPFSGIWFSKTFSHLMTCLFIFLTVSCEAQSLNLMKSSLPILLCVCFWCFS